jgi:hypothetical protein
MPQLATLLLLRLVQRPLLAALLLLLRLFVPPPLPMLPLLHMLSLPIVSSQWLQRRRWLPRVSAVLRRSCSVSRRRTMPPPRHSQPQWCLPRGCRAF